MRPLNSLSNQLFGECSERPFPLLSCFCTNSLVEHFYSKQPPREPPRGTVVLLHLSTSRGKKCCRSCSINDIRTWTPPIWKESCSPSECFVSRLFRTTVTSQGLFKNRLCVFCISQTGITGKTVSSAGVAAGVL